MREDKPESGFKQNNQDVNLHEMSVAFAIVGLEPVITELCVLVCEFK